MIDFALLIFLGACTILITRFLLVEGIQYTSDAWKLPEKVRGQILGYATSVPELVGTVSTASKGLLGAGLWNIAASNIINLALFVSALLYYRRHKLLAQVKFIDEIGFSIGAIIIPAILVLMGDIASSPSTAAALFLYFVIYLIVDYKLNPSDSEEEEEKPSRDDDVDVIEGKNKLGIKGLMFIALGLIGVVVVGNFLGGVAENIVTKLEVPEWAIGWILGFITSLPELTTFFAVFSAGKGSTSDADCQESLDNLAASNMSNLGLIYPIGIVVFLLVNGS